MTKCPLGRRQREEEGVTSEAVRSVLAVGARVTGSRKKESLEPQVPTRQGHRCPLTHGPPGQTCEESAKGIVFPFFRSGNCGSEDSRDLGEVPQVGSDKVERRIQVSWLPAPVSSTN